MIRKLTLAAGFGAGYVLGAKAGTQRYEQIVAKGRELAGMPAVQEFSSNVQQTASTVTDKAKATVNDKVASVTDKSSGTDLPSAPVATPAVVVTDVPSTSAKPVTPAVTTPPGELM